TSGGELRTPPDGGSALAVGAAAGAAIGGGLALLSLLGLAVGLYLLVVRVVLGVVSGALLGALFAIVTSSLRKQSRYGAASTYRDYLVKVDAPDRESAENVLDLLARAGGDPLPMR